MLLYKKKDLTRLLRTRIQTRYLHNLYVSSQTDTYWYETNRLTKNNDYFLQQAPPTTATYRMARGCARLSQARNSWNSRGSFRRTCICLDLEESKSPHIWTCQRNRWKSGFKTAEWSTRRRAKPRRGTHTAVASAQPVTQTIQGQRTRSLYPRSLLRKKKRCHPSETPQVPLLALTVPCCSTGGAITQPLSQ